jgi:DNA-binding beta-propeller fold protein YncE
MPTAAGNGRRTGPKGWLVLTAGVLAGGMAVEWLTPPPASAQEPSSPPAAGGDRPQSQEPQADYWIYVGAESADRIHRVRFGPDGILVEQTTSIGRFPTVTEGPHGLVVSPDGERLYMTTGHGSPDGMLWKFQIGADTLLADPIPLGRFPATLDITPDGLYVFVVNFNLHGEHVPSTMSVAYTPDLYEVSQIELCVMPHGSRMSPSGNHLYTVCMMDDVLVEVDTRSFQVSRAFSVAPGAEGPVEAHHLAAGADHGHQGDHVADRDAPAQAMDHGVHGPICSPTWGLPSADGSRVWVACNASDLIHEISTGDWELLRTFATGRGPYNLDVTPDDRLLVATLKQGHEVEFFDLESGASLGRTPTSTRVVHGVTVSPDGRYAFVSVEGVGAEPGKVDVFDLETLERVADVEVGQQASGIDFWRMEPR